MRIQMKFKVLGLGNGWLLPSLRWRRSLLTGINSEDSHGRGFCRGDQSLLIAATGQSSSRLLGGSCWYASLSSLISATNGRRCVFSILIVNFALTPHNFATLKRFELWCASKSAASLKIKLRGGCFAGWNVVVWVIVKSLKALSCSR